ncbi:hypothetical protein UFOVP1138_67 [uncultured Caudovirales phage]|uniref:Uncharacterized protein n=1 Tax=uncultured Caudovirales phage TaxID=2100421 RepID=A0A6J5PTE8_9CAUD|nr:hypothetical protein UFOVP975_53 [uncultured Caudovirales phage]CAB4186303.1 hypothetical protein UFOVP1138_67 [uncultured Caudovirales phage]CAB4204444.1 hypothetical protein UFOVP1394_64 [uncultured Caudovirales phage]
MSRYDRSFARAQAAYDAMEPPEHPMDYDDDEREEMENRIAAEEERADAAREEMMLKEMEERDDYERMLRMYGGCASGKCNY